MVSLAQEKYLVTPYPTNKLWINAPTTPIKIMHTAAIVNLVGHNTEDDETLVIDIDMFPRHDNPTTSVALIVAVKFYAPVGTP